MYPPYHLIATFILVVYILPITTTNEIIIYTLLGFLIDLDHIPWRLYGNLPRVRTLFDEGKFVQIVRELYFTFNSGGLLAYPIWHGLLMGAIISVFHGFYRQGVLCCVSVLVLHMIMDSWGRWEVFCIFSLSMIYGYTCTLFIQYLFGVTIY